MTVPTMAARPGPVPAVTSGIRAVEVGRPHHQVRARSLIWLPSGIPHTVASLTAEPVCTVG